MPGGGGRSRRPRVCSGSAAAEFADAASEDTNFVEKAAVGGGRGRSATPRAFAFSVPAGTTGGGAGLPSARRLFCTPVPTRLVPAAAAPLGDGSAAAAALPRPCALTFTAFRKVVPRAFADG